MSDYDYASDILNLGKPQPAPAPAGFDYAGQILSPAGAEMSDISEPESIPIGADMSLWERTKDIFTGDSRRQFEYDELPMTVYKQADGTWGEVNPYESPNMNMIDLDTFDIKPIGGMITLARDNPLAQAQIFKSEFPDAPVYFDDYMNPYTTITGKPQYLNRPGASMRDLQEAITVLGPEFFLGAKGSKYGKILFGTPGRMIGAGGGFASASLAQDYIAGLLGSEEGLDIKRAKLLAAFGLAGEGIAAGAEKLSPMFMRFWDKMVGGRYFDKAGNPTQAGIDMLRRAGVELEAVTPDFVNTYRRLAAEAANPEAAARSAASRSLPEPVPLTKGDISRDPAQQALEERMRRGAHGEEPQRIMIASDEAKDAALSKNIEAMQQRAGGGEITVQAPGQGMARVQQRLLDVETAVATTMRKYYKLADRSGASMVSTGYRETLKQTRFGLEREGYTEFTTPQLFNLLRSFEKAPRAGKARVREIPMRQVENTRKAISKFTRSSDPVLAGAARQALGYYDASVRAAVRASLVHGDSKSVQMYREAAGLRRVIGNVFEKNSILKMLIDTESGELLLAPSEALNVLWASGKLGRKGVGQRGTINALGEIKAILGPNSAEWHALREEAVLRMLTPLRRGNVRGADLTREVSADKLATSLETALEDSPEMMNILFTQNELAFFQRVKDVALMAKNRRTGVVNFSNSFNNLAQWAVNNLGVMGRVTGAALKRFTDAFERAYYTQRAQAAAAGRRMRPPRAELRPGYAGGLSVLGAEATQQDRTPRYRLSPEEQRRYRR